MKIARLANRANTATVETETINFSDMTKMEMNETEMKIEEKP